MTVAEPGSYTEIGGGWGWEIIECPQSLCEPPDCGPPAASSTYLCPDGVTEAGPGDCVSVNGFCAWEWTQCTCWVPGDAPTCAVEAVCLADRTWSCGDMVPPNTARGELCAM